MYTVLFLFISCLVFFFTVFIFFKKELKAIIDLCSKFLLKFKGVFITFRYLRNTFNTFLFIFAILSTFYFLYYQVPALYFASYIAPGLDNILNNIFTTSLIHLFNLYDTMLNRLLLVILFILIGLFLLIWRFKPNFVASLFLIIVGIFARPIKNYLASDFFLIKLPFLIIELIYTKEDATSFFNKICLENNIEVDFNLRDQILESIKGLQSKAQIEDSILEALKPLIDGLKQLSEIALEPSTIESAAQDPTGIAGSLLSVLLIGTYFWDYLKIPKWLIEAMHKREGTFTKVPDYVTKPTMKALLPEDIRRSILDVKKSNISPKWAPSPEKPVLTRDAILRAVLKELNSGK